MKKARTRLPYCYFQMYTYFSQSYIPFSQDYDLLSHATYVAETYSFMSTPNHIFLNNFSWLFCLLSEFLPEINSEAVVEEIFFHISFSWRCRIWDGNVDSRLISLLEYGHLHKWRIKSREYSL